ncbi:MAG: RND family transporter, partial [Bacteroidia bacterium]|nr:RND family transporter [Bacteroidia bacterium]
INNLKTSLLIAIIAITILMISLFRSIKMVSVSLTPNLFPLLLTAALMGFSGVPIKPSTIIIFSIALGISVDNTIHFLSRYRMELKSTRGNITESVMKALQEMGFSIIYSSIVLFFGFGIFVFSSFGGTKALGFLVSFTLLIAVLSNLLVLPSLLLSLNKWITTKWFKKEPLMEIYDEEEDIDTTRLPIEEFAEDQNNTQDYA